MNQLCWSHFMFASVPIFNLKGRQLISAWKSKSVAFTGPNDGFSLEVGGVISDGVASTCSELDPDSIGCYKWERYVDVISLPLHTGPILHFINLVHDKLFRGHQGLLNPHIMFGGINQNDWHTLFLCCDLLMTIPRDRLWCWACSTGQVISDGILLVHPGTVMAKLPGTQTGFCFESVVTCPMAPSFPLKFHQSFFRQVICLWGLTMFNLLGHNFICCSQCLVLLVCQNSERCTIGKIIKDWLLQDI